MFYVFISKQKMDYNMLTFTLFMLTSDTSTLTINPIDFFGFCMV